MSESVTDFIQMVRDNSGVGFGGGVGMEYTEVGPDKVVVTVEVGPHLHQPYGIVHGGVYCAIAEEVASIAGAVWLGGESKVVGVNNSTDFLRAVTEGTLTATGTPVHRGRSQQLWRVEIADDQGRLAAVGQVRLANLQ
ncbi:putative phenylacetic acid degradation-related protein [Dietzia sp. NCCP-2495]|uniref:PaaI family thioesterase n=1 Tax=Dietzia sp. NCCP-2495 TaxID=2934675 RepID=UPI00280F735B|nr:putative phenylacetic acid degradation-related protein [Dietzia sp. NCCP-2495]